MCSLKSAFCMVQHKALNLWANCQQTLKSGLIYCWKGFDLYNFRCECALFNSEQLDTVDNPIPLEYYGEVNVGRDQCDRTPGMVNDCMLQCQIRFESDGGLQADLCTRTDGFVSLCIVLAPSTSCSIDRRAWRCFQPSLPPHCQLSWQFNWFHTVWMNCVLC